MMNRNLEHMLRGLITFLGFFLLSASVVTCSFFMFLGILQSSIGYRFTESDLQKAAETTFVMVIFISLCITILTSIYSYFITERHVRGILAFTNKMATGTFNEQLKERNVPIRSELDQIVSNLNKLARELYSMETLKVDFVANITHEMKTPVTIIQNYAQLLQLEDLEEEKREEYLSSLLKATQRLGVLIQDVLKLNKLETQEVFKIAQRFSLSEQLVECLLLYEEKIEDKKIALSVDIAEGIDIVSDKELLCIVWSNLISNAIKFTPEGGDIHISLTSSDKEAAVSIADTGCGIDSNEINRIFSKFYQSDTAQKREGNGLGLALVKRIMDILDGEVRATSIKGKGSDFTIILPLNNSGIL